MAMATRRAAVHVARSGGRGQLLARTRRAFHVIPPGAPPPRSARLCSTAVGGSLAYNGRGTRQ